MKVLISDLDGTLYPKKSIDNEKQFNNNIVAVKKWIKQGNKFAVATARGSHHYEVIIEQLGFKPNFIGSNGAEVIYESGEVIIKQIPMQIFIDLCEYIKKKRLTQVLQQVLMMNGYGQVRTVIQSRMRKHIYQLGIT